MANILGPKPSAKTSGLIPPKNPGKTTASIPSPKKIDSSLKPKVTGVLEKPNLAAKNSSFPKPQDLPGKPLKASATPGAISRLAVDPSTDLQINRKKLVESGDKLPANLGQRETLERKTLGDHAGIDLADKLNTDGHPSAGSSSGEDLHDNIKGRLGAQIELAPGKLANLGNKNDVVDSSFFGKGEASWNENSRGKLNRKDSTNYADIVYTYHDEATGKDWKITVSLQNPGEGFSENNSSEIYSDRESGSIVIVVTRSVKDFKTREQIVDYADNAVDTYGDQVGGIIGQNSDAEQTTQSPSKEEPEDEMHWSWEDDSSSSSTGSSGDDGDEMHWASEDDSSSGISPEDDEDNPDNNPDDEMHWAWEDDSESSGDTSSSDDSAEPSATPDPDSDSGERTANDEDSPRGNSGGQQDPHQVESAIASNTGGGVTVRFANDDEPRGGVSQTKTHSSSDKDTIRMDPDDIRNGDIDTERLAARIAEESNPEGGQGGPDQEPNGNNLPGPLGGLAGGPVANPTGGGGNPSTLRSRSSGTILQEAIRQKKVQLNADTLKNVQQVEK